MNVFLFSSHLHPLPSHAILPSPNPSHLILIRLAIVWQVTKSDITSTLTSVCNKALHDHSCTNAVRQQRREGDSTRLFSHHSRLLPSLTSPLNVLSASSQFKSAPLCRYRCNAAPHSLPPSSEKSVLHEMRYSDDFRVIFTVLSSHAISRERTISQRCTSWAQSTAERVHQ